MKNICGKALAAMTTALILSVVGLTGCADGNSSEQTSELTSSSVTESNIDRSIDASDLDVGYDETEACVIAFNGTEAEINGSGASSENGIVTVSESGTYILSGSVSNGRVVVDADKDAEIKLIFKGVNISCSDNAPVYVSNAKKVYITLEENTENSLSDGSEYSLGEDDSNTDGALFSKGDLTINGSGKLSVTSNYKHAIVSKDDLVITDGVLDISSASSAIVGKDCVKISGGNFEIDAGTNAIKSTNAEETDKGFIGHLKDGKVIDYTKLNKGERLEKLWEAIRAIEEKRVPVCTLKTAREHTNAVLLAQERGVRDLSNLAISKKDDKDSVYYTIPGLGKDLQDAYSSWSIKLEY